MAEIPERGPEPEGSDLGHAVVKTALSYIPVAGAAAAALFEFLVRPSYERRKIEWMESMARKINQLEAEGIELNQLRDDESFTTTLLEASNIAIRTNQDEKLESLRNAVLNSALRNEPDEDIRAIYLSLVDRFTAWHLRILKLFQDPKAGLDRAGVDYSGYYMGGPAHVLEDVFPELKDQREFYDLIVSDLSAAGLFALGTLHSTMTAQGMLAPRTTPMGNRFVKFISEPEGS